MILEPEGTFTCQPGFPPHSRKFIWKKNADVASSNIAKGIFNSDKGNLIQNIAQIPCDTIQTLESDAEEAEAFVNQIQAGQVPSIITNLPQEAVSELGDIFEVATMVIDDVAGAAVTDIVDVFNEIEDGSIVSVVEGIPSDIIDAITNGWNDFTNEVTSVWGDVTCFFEGGCSSSSSVGFCSVSSSAPASASASATDSGGAITSAYYSSGSSAAAATSASAAAYTSSYLSSYYAAASSAAAAYTSSYYSEYYASESSAAAAASAESTYSVATASPAAPPDTATPTIPKTVQSISQAIHQTTQETTTQSSAPAQVQSTTQSTTQSPQVSSNGSMSYEWADFSILAMVACGIFGLAIFL